MGKKDKYQLTSSVNEGIVEIIITGELSAEDIDNIRSKVIEIIRESDARGILTDVRAATGPHNIIDAYYRVRTFPPDIRTVPYAIIDTLEDQEYMLFFETTAANAGWRIKWFTDVESARIWLKSIL